MTVTRNGGGEGFCIVGPSHEKLNRVLSVVVNPKARPGFKKDHKLGLPRHHSGTDHPKEILNVPTL